MRSWKYRSDLRLAGKASAGDEAAWEELIESYGRRIFNIALHFATTAVEAEDLTQEIFLKLYRNLHRYRGDVPLVAWSLRLSRNLCIEQYRRTRLERQAPHFPVDHLELSASEEGPQDELARRQQMTVVHRALAKMTEELAAAVVLRDLQGLSYLEVAAALGIPMGTLKSRLSRARKELAEQVAVELSKPGMKSSGLAEVSSC